MYQEGFLFDSIWTVAQLVEPLQEWISEDLGSVLEVGYQPKAFTPFQGKYVSGLVQTPWPRKECQSKRH